MHGKEANLPLIVVEGSVTPLFGRNWLEQINLNWAEIAKIKEVESVTSESKTPQGLKDFWKDIKRYSRRNLDSVRE